MPATSTEHGTAPADRSWSAEVVVALIVAVAALGGVVGVFLVQVKVSGAGVTRSCGSVLDAVVDRSGWDLWWARDLDEPGADVRAALLRTNLCPDAINRSIAIATALGVIGVLSGLFVVRRTRTEPRLVSAGLPAARQLARLGAATWATGLALVIGGLIAVVVLVADADSTLFLYTDRHVVGVVGLIVLMPAMALFVIGRALLLVARVLDRDDRDEADA